MQPRTTKKLLQDNCQRLRSQIEELELRLRSSSVSRTVGGQPMPQRSSLKRNERQNTVKEQYNFLRQRDQAKEVYQMSLAKLTEDFQRDKDKLRKNYEEKLSEIDRLQQEQCKTIINVARMPPRPNKENMLNITNIEKGRGRLVSQNHGKPYESNIRTPLGKNVTVASQQRSTVSNNHLQYDSSSDEGESNRQPIQRLSHSKFSAQRVNHNK